MATDNHSADTDHRIHFGRFFVFTGLQLLLALALFNFFTPKIFAQEVSKPVAILVTAFLFGFPLSLFEYLYHRYLLHSAIFPFMRSMHRAHTLHHSLTSVKAPVNGNEPARLVEVTSEYPIEHEHQAESMDFPLYSVSIFMAVFLILFGLPAKLIFPHEPVIFGLFLGVTLYYSSYELWHAVLHLSYEQFWQPGMENRWTGPTIKRVYGFHLMHHWRPTANLAIVGLWGIAVWDHVFRTHRRPTNMPLDGAKVNFHDAALNEPLWPISVLDSSKGKWFKWSRNVENWSARVFLGRKDPS